jgi:NADPH-dependent F420 reductase
MDKVGFGLNEDIVSEVDTVILTIPYMGLDSTLEKIKSKINAETIVISPIVPIVFREGEAKLVHVHKDSAAETIANALPKVKVVAALHTVSAERLANYSKPVKGDVIVCSDDFEAKRTVMILVEEIPNLRAVDGGRLENAHIIEEFPALLIRIGHLSGKASLGIKLI